MRNSHTKGAVLLLNILVLGTMSIVATAALARGTLNDFLDSAEMLNAWNTRAGVAGCIDEALIHLKKDNTFTAATLYTGTTTCAMSFTTPASGQKRIVASLTEGTITRQMTVDVTLSTFAVTQITEP